MGFSPLANMGLRIPDGGRSVARNAAVTGMGIHHNAGVDSYGEASNPNREVSANYWIANDGTIIPNVDETRRAFTSGHPSYPAGAQADHRNITVEVSNSPEGIRNGDWGISDAALRALVELIADVWRRYGLGAVTRGASRGLGVHSDWVRVECPGRYIMNNLGVIIAQANAINAGEPAATPVIVPEEEDIMAIYLEATGNSSPIDAGNPGSSRIWAGADREINGAKYSPVWERSDDGSIRRLFAAEWAAIQEAYKAAGRKVPLVTGVHGNAIEEMYLTKRAAPSK